MARTLKRKPRAWVRVAGSEAGGDAVRFLLTPATALEYELALENARKAGRSLSASQEVRQRYGMDELPVEALAGEDEDVILGISTVVLATELAMIIAAGMDGYFEDNGEPVEFTRRNVALVMQDWSGPKSLAQHFLDVALAPVFEALTEGKPSAAVPDGSGAAAGNTAQDAGQTAPPAPGASPE